MQSDSDFKRTHKPAACTQAPWAHLIPAKVRASTLLAIKQESLDIYGHTMMECPNIKVCVGASCLGRPLPYESPTAKPFIEELEKTHKVVDGKLFVTKCDGCPIFQRCKAPCKQIGDYLERHNLNHSPQLNEWAYSIDSKEQILAKKAATYTDTSSNDNNLAASPLLPNLEIPWDCLGSKRKSVVETYIFKQRDFLHTARLHGLYNQATAKYVLYAALTTLSEVAIMRKFLKENSHLLTQKQLHVMQQTYIHNKNFTIIAKSLEVSPQAVHQIVRKIIKKYNITWPIFVRKKHGKIIYNVPYLFK